MSLADGYIDLPAGKLANVVTCLEMRERPAPRPDPPGRPLALRRSVDPGAAWYRTLFAKVGEPHLWSSRLAMDEVTLTRVIRDPEIEIYVLEDEGTGAGLLELDFRSPGDCELAFFGVTESLVGRGVGRRLMNRAIELAWSRPIRRFWLHTCTLDHPNALQFYVRSGFVPYKRQIEILDDPRALGLLPKTAAPNVPLL